MFISRNKGLDALLQARVAEDRRSSWRVRYSQSPSLAFFVISSLYRWLRIYSPITQPAALADINRIRLVCVSDTHNHLLPHSSVPPGDVFIHTGDITNNGTPEELKRSLDWIRSLPHAHKIIIGGNHDTALAEPDELKQLDLAGVTYLCDETLELVIRGQKLRLYGSPWTPRFGNFAFQYPKGAGAEIWNSIPQNTDVLITHGPANAHCDRDGLGCEDFLGRMWQVRPRVLVCGHIHAGRGIERLEWDGIQKQWEWTVKKRRDAGWWDVVAMVYEIVCGCLKNRTSKKEGSIVVNCAIVGGARDQLVRDAVVVDI
ncbi:hypothetical protein FRC09_014609 [Ceratobasidium sp. 395]|nr:hypothetical protein FRC09_014609 [Ceratobasidium sp. 395]